jgi:hypothetical protein
MKTVNFRDDVLFPAAELLGIDVATDFLNDFARPLARSVNSKLREGWDFWDWPELTLTEERAFRRIWNPQSQFVPGDEVFFIGTMSYYAVRRNPPLDPPVGTSPTDISYFEPLTLTDRYIAYEQDCRGTIGDVYGVYATNPRLNGGCGVLALEFRPSEKGIDVVPWAGPTVFVHYKLRVPQFTIEGYDPARAYKANDLIYWTDGEVYRARSNTTATDPGTVFWAKMAMPYTLSEFVKYAAAAEMADDAYTKASLRADAEAAIRREVDKLLIQGERHFYRMGGAPQLRYIPLGVSSFWWSVSPPWTSTSGTVTTLTEQCEDEWGVPVLDLAIKPTAQFLPYIDSLRGSSSSLEYLSTTDLGTLSVVEFLSPVEVAPGIFTNAESFWQLMAGPADSARPSEEVAPLDYAVGTNERHWLKVGGY